MASLKELVAKHGLPCPVKSVVRYNILPFVILNVSPKNPDQYICYNSKYKYFEVDKECKYTNDYEFDDSKLYGEYTGSKVYELLECIQKAIELASSLNLTKEHEQLIGIRNNLKNLYEK